MLFFLCFCQQPDAPENKFEGLFKEESLQSIPEIRESQEWGVSADGEHAEITFITLDFCCIGNVFIFSHTIM